MSQNQPAPRSPHELVYDLIDTMTPGELLPRAAELAELWGIRRNQTIGYALQDAHDQGLVTRRGRNYFVADVAPAPMATPATDEELKQRAKIITRLRRTSFSLALADRSREELVTLAATGDPGLAAGRIRIAADTLRSPHAIYIRSAIGLLPETEHLTDRLERRDAVGGNYRRESLGAQELANHIEVLLDLASRGVLNLHWGREHPRTRTKSPKQKIQKLNPPSRRVRLAELEARGWSQPMTWLHLTATAGWYNLDQAKTAEQTAEWQTDHQLTESGTEAALNRSQLIERGWSQAMIRDILTKPDKMVPHPAGSLMHVFATRRILAAEQTPEFAARHAKAVERSTKAKKQADKNVEAAAEWLTTHPINIPAIPDHQLTQRAITYYENLWRSRGEPRHVGDAAPKNFINRITVNYLRHLTTNETDLDQLRGPTKAQNERLLLGRTLDVIAHHYPALADECATQKQNLTD